MKLKLFRKETWLKKSTWIVLSLFIVSIIGVISIPKFSKAEGRVNTIRVLEIEPGNNFNLPNSQNVGSTKVEVTKMNMPQYISMIDEINGKYDVVYIGRNNNELKAFFDSEKVYRDYTAPLSQAVGELKVNENDPDLKANSETYLYAQRLWYIQSDVTTLGKWDDFKKKINGYSYENKNYVEFYSENDITQKRANEILSMINSGQLVYVSNAILNDTNLSTTNLCKNFINASGTNYKKVNDSDVTVNKIVSDYSNISSPKIEMVSTPQGDKDVKGAKAGTDTNDVKYTVAGLSSNRTMNFNFKVYNPENCKVQLYLDYNGDGLFKDSEMAPINETSSEDEFTLDLSSCSNDGTDTYSLSYELDSTFVGWLQWKLVLTNSNNQKSYEIGNARFRPIDGKKKDIKVLQIHPKSGTQDKDFYLNKGYFDNYINGVEDYNITYDIIPINTLNGTKGFNQRVADGEDIYNNYDMIIVGFSDSYGGGFDNDFSQAAVNVIQKFADNGKSLMLTHDTMTLNIFGPSNTKEWDSKTGPKLLTRSFRDILGQARYADPYRTEETDTAYYDTLDENGNVIAKKTIPHDSVSSVKTINDKTVEGNKTDVTNPVSLGITLFANVKQWEDKTSATTVKKVNTAQITDYPYELGDTITISKTHTQWYQLNLEDPDIAPWFNLSNGKVNDLDARNFYYTYSKGNITYSGTGHSNPGETKQELELFVNTIVKCIRGANVAPEIKNYENNTTNEIANASNLNINDKNADYFEFDTIPSDPDGDRITLGVKVNGQNDGIQYVVNNTTYTSSTIKVKTGTKVKVRVPNSYYSDLELGQSIPVVVTGRDPYKHTATKTFNLVMNDDTPSIAIVKHGMYKLDYNVEGEGRNLTNYTDEEKLPAINKWFEENSALDKASILSSSQVSYFATVPFAATINVDTKTSTLQLSLDYEKDSANQTDALSLVGDIEVYKLQSDGKLKLLGTMSKTTTKDVYSYDLTREALKDDTTSDICEVVVKYKAKTLVQPTVEEANNTLLSIKNKLQVISKGQEIGSGQLDAQVTIGRVVLDRPLF